MVTIKEDNKEVQSASGSISYRKVGFVTPEVEVRSRPDGILYVRSKWSLGAHPERISDRLIQWAREAPKRTYMAHRNKQGKWRHITYAQALDFARRIGTALLARGLSAERPLLVLSENDLEHSMLALAAQYVGVVYVPVSTAYSTLVKDYARLRDIVELTTPGLVYAADGKRYGAAIEAALPSDCEVAVGASPLSSRPCVSYDDLATVDAKPSVDEAQQATGPETIAMLLFTSGSTNAPKAVIITNHMICSDQQMICQAYPFLSKEPPVIVDWLPWSHAFGTGQNIGIILYNGGTMYIDEGKITPQLFGETLRNLREIAPTLYLNVPKGFEMLAVELKADPQFRRHFFSKVKMLFYAGASMAQPIWDSIYASAVDACGERITINCGLGMTETGPSALFVNREDIIPGMNGIPAPGLEVKLVPIDDKMEIRYRGPNVTPGYWRSPETNAKAFDEEGYFCSGDAVKFVDPSRPELGLSYDGRISENFKLSTGTWVSVGALRLKFVAAANPYVQDVAVAGLDRDEIGVLVFPNIASCRRLSGLDDSSPFERVLDSAPICSLFMDVLNRLSREATGSSTRVARALLLAEPPSLDRGECTDKGTINQRAVLTKRADAIEELYNDANPKVIKPTI